MVSVNNSWISLLLVFWPTFSALHSGHADSPDECYCEKSARTFTVSVWRHPKFILESASARPRLAITNSMSLLPFLFLFIVALYRYIFLFLFRYCRRCTDFFCYLFQMISANAFYLYSGMEGGRLRPISLKDYHPAWLPVRPSPLLRRPFLHFCSLYVITL